MSEPLQKRRLLRLFLGEIMQPSCRIWNIWRFCQQGHYEDPEPTNQFKVSEADLLIGKGWWCQLGAKLRATGIDFKSLRPGEEEKHMGTTSIKVQVTSGKPNFIVKRIPTKTMTCNMYCTGQYTHLFGFTNDVLENSGEEDCSDQGGLNQLTWSVCIWLYYKKNGWSKWKVAASLLLHLHNNLRFVFCTWEDHGLEFQENYQAIIPRETNSPTQPPRDPLVDSYPWNSCSSLWESNSVSNSNFTSHKRGLIS